MKQAIHPTTHNIQAKCGQCGTEMSLRSTLADDLRVEVCVNCHPFIAGAQRSSLAEGSRITRYRERYKGFLRTASARDLV